MHNKLNLIWIYTCIDINSYFLLQDYSVHSLLSLDTLILHSVSGQHSAVKMATQISVGDLVGIPQCQCYMHCTQNPLHVHVLMTSDVGFNTFMIQSAESGQ